MIGMVKPRLDQVYSWKELCNEVWLSLKDRKHCKNKEKLFKKWFMEREALGWLFGRDLVYRAWTISRDLAKGLDHFVVISGREGLGKSTLAMQLAAWVCPNFVLENIVYGAQSYVTFLQERLVQYNNGDLVSTALVLDEGTELLSRESMNKTNVILQKTFFVQRVLGLIVIINIPNFHMVDTTVRKHRVRTLIDVKDRGKCMVVHDAGIPIVAKKGEQSKTVNPSDVPAKFWFYSDFTKQLPKHISYEEYEKIKVKGVADLLRELRGDVSPRYKKMATLARELGMKQQTLRRQLKAGKYVGKKIGNEWYIDIEDANRLIYTNKK